jgi:hypothetical protein
MTGTVEPNFQYGALAKRFRYIGPDRYLANEPSSRIIA